MLMLLKKGKIKTLKKQFFFSVSTLICALQFILCTNDYNPFQDNTLARAVIISQLNSNDSLEMYSTQNLTVLLTCPDLIQQVRVQVTHNRYFKDSTINSNAFVLLEPVKFDFMLSFYDTGWQEVKISTLKKNGEEIDELVRFFITQTLSQPPVIVNLGEQVNLETTPVKDEKVIYNWKFGNVTIQSKAAKTFNVIKALSGTGRGELWVCDVYGNDSSPHTTFQYSFVDTLPPQINCINENTNDTLVTSDSIFHLFLKITDNGSPKVKAEIKVDDEIAGSFSKVDGSVFIQTIEFVKMYSQPIKLHVVTSDGSGNTTEKDFFVKYNVNVKKETDLVVITVDAPQKDSISASKKSYNVFGTIRQYLENPSVIKLKIKVNDSSAGEKNVNVTKATSAWSFDIQLALGGNRIEIQALDTNGALICTKNATLIYDGDHADTTKPQIVALSFDRVAVPSGSRQMIIPCDSSKLRIITFDDGSGIKQVLVDGLGITSKDSNNYTWEQVVYLSHDKYKKYDVSVVDTLGNRADTSIELIYNKLPYVDGSFERKKTLFAGIPYSEDLPVTDLNDDHLRFTKESGPAALFVGQDDGSISWTPTMNDTGVIFNVKININDGLGDTTINFDIVVKKNNLTPFKLKTSERDFPSVIESDDTITIPILADSLNNTSPVVVSATTADGRIVRSFANRIMWHPDSLDTGIVHLIIKVSDKGGQGVTLYPAIRVIPQIDKIKIDCKWTGDTTEIGYLDLKEYGNVGDTLKLEIIDAYRKFRMYSADIAFGIEPQNNISVDSSGLLKIVVDNKKQKVGIDSLTVVLKDSFSHELIVKKYIDFGLLKKPTFITPNSDTLITDSTVNIRWTGSAEEHDVMYQVFLLRADSAFTDPIAEIFDTTMRVKLTTSGTYYARIVSVRNDTLVRSTILTFHAALADPMVVSYTPVDFSKYLIAGQDSINLSLSVKNNQGPYTFIKTGIFADNFLIDKNGLLTFKPNDTGTYNFEILVQDSVGHQAQIVIPKIVVVSVNRPCSLNVVPPIYPIINIGNQAVTYKFTIVDPDLFVFEEYNVRVRLFTTEMNIKVDSTRTFSVKIDSAQFVNVSDSLRVIVTDKGGFGDTISAKIKSTEPKMDIEYLNPLGKNLQTTGSIHFSWNVLNSTQVGFSYILYLDTNSDFTNNFGIYGTTYCDISGLKAGTKYYWRIVAVTADTQVVGAVKSFTTAN